MLLFSIDVDFGCDWVLIQIFYAHRFTGRDVDACNQHSWHHTSHIQICKLLIVRWSTRAWFLYVWDLLQLFEKWRLGISRCLTAYQDPSTVCAQSQLIFVPWTVEQFVLIAGQGPVVQKPIIANPRLKVNQGVYFYTQRCCSTLIFGKNFTLEVNFEKQK